jgi:hypothetical protein
MMKSRYNVQATLIGRKAAELLGIPGYAGEVLAIVSSAVYLAGHDGELLWLGQEGLPAHPRCILSSFHATNIEVGMEFVATSTCLGIGSDMTFGLANAVRWTPHAIEQMSGQPVRGCLRETLASIQPLPVRGLGHALTWMTRPAGRIDYSAVSSTDRFLLRRVEPIIRELLKACHTWNMERILSVGRGLVGLGPGLTPSGDDFLGGLLFSAHYLRAAYPTLFEQNDDLLRGFLKEARLLTNSISHTILSDLAYGHGPAPLYDLIILLLQGSTRQAEAACAKQLIQIGHTSGWDMLAGALTGMLLRENLEL